MGSEDKKQHRVVTFLNRDQVDYLDKLGKDALFSTGSKFPRTRVISALIDLLRQLNINGENLRTDKDLVKRLLDTLGAELPEARQLANEILEDRHDDSQLLR